MHYDVSNIMQQYMSKHVPLYPLTPTKVGNAMCLFESIRQFPKPRNIRPLVDTIRLANILVKLLPLL